jgi:YVTN family beta-propeller protein
VFLFQAPVTANAATARIASSTDGLTPCGLPSSIYSDGTHVWTANGTSNSVTELDASTGQVVQTISGPSFGFNYPCAVFSDRVHVWVANLNESSASLWSVIELNAKTGTLIRVLSDPSYGFLQPRSISGDGTHVWVANDRSLTEIDGSTGALVQVLNQTTYNFCYPSVASDRIHLWAASCGYNGSGIDDIATATGSLTLSIPDFALPLAISDDHHHVWVLNQRPKGQGSLEKVGLTGHHTLIRGAQYEFYRATAVSSDGTDVWVTNPGLGSVTELSALTGALVQVINGSSYQFNGPQAISADGTHVWVANVRSITEMDASTGALVQVIN